LLFSLVFLLLSASAIPAGEAAAAGPEVLRIRYFTGPEYTRVVLDLSRPGSFDVREVRNPERLAVNVRRGSFLATDPIDVNDGLLRRIRRNSGSKRAQVVLDLARAARFKSFSLPADDGRPDRVVIDLYRTAGNGGPSIAATLPDSGDRRSTPDPGTSSKREAVSAKPFTVVIDPGHGGLDPGAIRNGIQEKDVVLKVAREMARLIDGLPGYEAVLTRNTDYYPSLNRRVAIAAEKNGDLFISVHCNTHRRASVSGMEVYFLSLQGATDREAQELADKENAADLVGLDPELRHEDMVMNILMDLHMTQVLHESGRLAEILLTTAGKSGVVKGRKVKQARFQVLRSLAMPSALVEVAYLSNRADRELLTSGLGKQKIAAVIVEGILAWRRDSEAVARLGLSGDPGWTNRYSVRRGDSLWRLARRHGTTVVEISRRNNLESQAIMVGQVLRLPEGYREP